MVTTLKCVRHDKKQIDGTENENKHGDKKYKNDRSLIMNEQIYNYTYLLILQTNNNKVFKYIVYYNYGGNMPPKKKYNDDLKVKSIGMPISLVKSIEAKAKENNMSFSEYVIYAVMTADTETVTKFAKEYSHLKKRITELLKENETLRQKNTERTLFQQKEIPREIEQLIKENEERFLKVVKGREGWDLLDIINLWADKILFMEAILRFGPPYSQKELQDLLRYALIDLLKRKGIIYSGVTSKQTFETETFKNI